MRRRGGANEQSRIRDRSRVGLVLAATLALLASGCWAQFRSDASHSGTNALEKTVSAANVFGLTAAWSAQPGNGATASSVAVFEPNAYVGSVDGTLVAYDSASGAVKWTGRAGGRIDSSPASSSGLVWVGSDDGKLDAFSTADGTLRWATSLSGAVISSPSVVGNVVVVGSAGGGLSALDATAGTVLWSTPTGGPVTSSPAVSNGMVYVGSGDGHVYAFNAITGAVAWSTPTGGPVTSSPSVNGGVVYVGSTDAHLYALNAGTGAGVWSTPTVGAISSSPAVADGIVYVGSDDGTLHAFDLVGGASLWSGDVGGIPSSPAVASGYVYVTATGGLVRAYHVLAACTPPVSRIACENTLPGSPSSGWDIAGSGDPTIQGFATDMSVDHGEIVHFKVQTPASSYHLDIYRMGFYGGTGARRVTTVRPSAALPQTQPACLTTIAPLVHLIDCGNWAESASWVVPANATSGIYFARLVRDDTGGASHVFFVVRDDEHHSNVLFQTSDATWQTYNDWGGAGSYSGIATAKSSYNRPFITRTAEGGQASVSWVFNAEYPMVRWLESNGYDVSYASTIDTDRSGSRLLDHKVFLSVGHDEYWSAGQRAAVTAARDAGVNLGFFSGNTSFWKTRWEPSIDGTNTPYRTLVTYKESGASVKVDPSPMWTGFWRDPRLSPPSDGGRPENALNGTLYGDLPFNTPAVQVSAEEGKLRLWRDTPLARQTPGSIATLGSRTAGYELDWDLDNGSRPPSTADLSTTSYSGLFPHHVTEYRAPSGALVFSAASVQWSWGLDSHHDNGSSPTSPEMQQATVNILADMGAQPRTFQPGLVAETATLDTIAPTASIASSGTGTSPAVGTAVTATGTATDAGGGAVAGVEVSVDGGISWHPAAGRGQWTYTWVPTTLGPVTVQARAVDDSANLGASTSAPGWTVAARQCPCSLWDPSTKPVTADDGATTPLEVGVKIRPDTTGYITGIRFYKSALNTGTHIANLWTIDGTLLSTATFTNESASGWQSVNLPQPVPVTAGTAYVASYHTDTGHVARDALYFDNWLFSNTRGLDIPPLHALWSRDPTGPNGVLKNGPSGFPTDSGLHYVYFDNANYWVDAIYNTQPLATGAPTRNGARAPTGTHENRNQATRLANQLQAQQHTAIAVGRN